ncbi:unnamed protein product [Danaus chrysippus]|uniref:(African queen) hypothetical protein n=1 Tax=Danaus chrysippus TaxID=151541 RepID=A0A8J2R4F9_9NEOP|nr:unnamed protein product [Danaus chrysippus]
MTKIFRRICFLFLFACTASAKFCKGEILRLVKCLGVNGIATALNVNEKARLSTFLGIIILNPVLKRNETLSSTAIGAITSRKMNSASYDWLIVSKSVFDFKTVSDILNKTEMRFDQNIVATFPDLGVWSENQSMALVESPFPTEARNFMGEYFKVGRCNYSEDTQSASDNEGPSAPELLDDVLQTLSIRLNATSVTRYYGKLGFRTYEGAWTGLLGALMDGSVDIALEPVTAISSHHDVMDFIFPISKTMCSIYIRHHETSAVRDIFLAPFSFRLIVCVFLVVLIAAIILILIHRVTAAYMKIRHMSCMEGLIWSTGIVCQQGGSWTPPNPSASILLIVCLLFALVIYNSYAAFITSVLSVRVASVGSVADVLQSSSFKIGYIKNSADQMYLMSTKDAQLNAFYIRGYSEAENLVLSAEEGLVRAAKQDYAFFAGQRIARSTLRSLSQARGRCALRELPVHSTQAQLAFPLSRGSPYSKLILISLLQIRSSGALARLETVLVPGMPQCTPPTGFASARAADVQTALYVILTGLLASIILGE